MTNIWKEREKRSNLTQLPDDTEFEVTLISRFSTTKLTDEFVKRSSNGVSGTPLQIVQELRKRYKKLLSEFEQKTKNNRDDYFTPDRFAPGFLNKNSRYHSELNTIREPFKKVKDILNQKGIKFEVNSSDTVTTVL